MFEEIKEYTIQNTKEEKILQSYFYDIYTMMSPEDRTTLVEYTSEYITQWHFIGRHIRAKQLILLAVKSDYILKRAKGKFISYKDCLKTFPDA